MLITMCLLSNLRISDLAAADLSSGMVSSLQGTGEARSLGLALRSLSGCPLIAYFRYIVRPFCVPMTFHIHRRVGGKSSSVPAEVKACPHYTLNAH